MNKKLGLTITDSAMVIVCKVMNIGINGILPVLFNFCIYMLYMLYLNLLYSLLS